MDEPRPAGPLEERRRPPRSDPGRLGTVVLGFVVIAIGLWFFADRTLGLDLPRINWGALWPVILIGLGIWLVIGARGRRV